MPLNLNSDAVSLIALIVSLLAFLIAFLQVLQQYASTAYEYRKCSARTMGGWATQTKRIFVPSEIRFEITYVVPHIEVLELREGMSFFVCKMTWSTLAHSSKGEYWLAVLRQDWRDNYLIENTTPGFTPYDSHIFLKLSEDFRTHEY